MCGKICGVRGGPPVVRSPKEPIVIKRPSNSVVKIKNKIKRFSGTTIQKSLCSLKNDLYTEMSSQIRTLSGMSALSITDFFSLLREQHDEEDIQKIAC